MSRITKADLMNQIQIHKNRYDRLLAEHIRLLAEIQSARARTRKAEEVARAIRDGDIRYMLTIISIFAVVLGIIYLFTK